MDAIQYHISFKKLGRDVKKDEKALSNDVKAAVKDVEHVADQVAKVVEEGIDDAIKVVKNVGEDVIFAPLLFAKPTMKKEIAKRGLKDDGTLLDITGKFVKALLDEQPKHFDRFPGIRKLNAVDTWGLSVAPVYIKAPVSAGLAAIGVPSDVPGLPPAPDVLWNFFHKEAKKPGTHIAAQVKASQDKAAKKNALSDFLKNPVKLGITLAIVTGIIIAVVYFTTKKP